MVTKQQSENISLSLIIKRNLKSKYKSDDDEVAKECLKLSHVRLDRENIKHIDNLECLGSVTNLYLQQNSIELIQNLSCLSSSLRFLTLAGNRISHIEGLLSLQLLGFLDLSDNLVANLDVNQLPQSLVFVNFKNNECTSSLFYKRDLIDRLPKLKSIDGDLLNSDSDDGSDDASSDLEFSGEESEEDLAVGAVRDVCTGMLESSTARMDEVAERHRLRLEEIARPYPRVADRVGVPGRFDLSGFEEKISNILHTMIGAERDVMNSFNLPPPAACPRGESFPPAPPQSPARSPNKKRSFTSVGTCTSGTTSPLPPSKPLAAKKSVAASSNRAKPDRVSPANRKRPSSKTQPASASSWAPPDSLVRIPGARPFHKP